MKKEKQNKNKMNNKNKRMLLILLFCMSLSIVLVVNVIIPFYTSKKEQKEEEEYIETIKNATILVTLKEDMTTGFMSDVHVSDFITEINGTLIDDYKIDTNAIGKKEVYFEYVNNEESLRVPYAFEIEVKDTTPPSIWLSDSKTVNVGTTYEDLMEKITCADDYDDNPKCEIIGKYNLNKVGSYNLTFQATDASNNQTTKKFTLVVRTPPKTSSSSSGTRQGYPISEIIKDYKTENTKIGIDVSGWQGDIDFEAVKNSGVEFVFIRVGSTKGINADYFVDSKFKRNIEGFNKVGIPVGIYFYSYANSKESAINDAKWVIEQIKDYQVDFPVAYDWESWSFFNNFHQSFYSTSMNAKAFLDTLNAAGYDGLLYSSASYLKKVWYDTSYPVWLAHYTDKTDYDGQYTYWQFCSNGKVPGISGFVDMNILYLDK